MMMSFNWSQGEIDWARISWNMARLWSGVSSKVSVGRTKNDARSAGIQSIEVELVRSGGEDYWLFIVFSLLFFSFIIIVFFCFLMIVFIRYRACST